MTPSPLFHPAFRKDNTDFSKLPFAGVFEAHVTVDACVDELPRFAARCRSLGAKFVQIELPRGAVRSQPMTCTHHRGTMAAAGAEVFGLARALGAEFRVSRVKLEAIVPGEGVPHSDADALPFPDNYFEFHVKVRLPTSRAEVVLPSVLETVRPHGAHLSSNARRTTSDIQERFVTLRVYGAGRLTADARWKLLVSDLRAVLAKAGILRGLSHQLREYTVYDSNVAIDRGWLTEAA